MRPENQILWDNLNTIKNILVMSEESFSNELGLSISEYNKMRLNCDPLSMKNLFEFAEKYNFHAMDLLDHKFDFQQLISNQNNRELFPDKYSFATYSQTKPIVNVINYIEKTRGIRAKVNILRHFQLSEELLLKEGQKTNILLITDIINYANTLFQFNENEFFQMGKMTPFQNAGKYIKKELKGISSVEQNIECFFEGCTKVFDQNCNYSIESMKDGIAVINATPKKNVLEELGVSKVNFGNREVCSSRMGVISSLTWFNFGEYAEMKKLPSGEESMSSKYLLDYTKIKKLSRFSGSQDVSSPVYN